MPDFMSTPHHGISTIIDKINFISSQIIEMRRGNVYGTKG
jgi:hypothetical protein